MPVLCYYQNEISLSRSTIKILSLKLKVNPIQHIRNIKEAEFWLKFSQKFVSCLIKLPPPVMRKICLFLWSSNELMPVHSITFLGGLPKSFAFVSSSLLREVLERLWWEKLRSWRNFKEGTSREYLHKILEAMQGLIICGPSPESKFQVISEILIFFESTSRVWMTP